ncbi:MAG: O-antigen ligase C-terminal domain-containing protein [Rubrivivax sp.]|nr:O-antigen ligase C-terminal domain-containing protein [Rubrivivax sp.]
MDPLGPTAPGIWWQTWAALAAVPWLLPTRTAPWATFYAEALAATVWLALAAGCIARDRRLARAPPSGIDGPAVMAFALMTWSAFQAAIGRLVFPSEVLMAVVYLGAFGGAMVLGRRCREGIGPRFVDLLWAGLLGAALLSAGFAVGQWLQVEPLGWLTPLADIDGRAIANVGQANNLATLLCWGLIGLWWAHRTGRVRAPVGALAAAWLAFAMALTQSRTPWLGVIVLMAVAVAGRRWTGGWRTLGALAVLAAFYVASWLTMLAVGDALGLIPPRDAADQTSPGFRPVIWSIALQAISERPWLGWGWNQFIVAWVELAPGRLPRPSLNGYTHNFALDLLVSSGVVVGAVAMASLLVWAWRTMRAARSAEEWLLLAGVGVFGVHAMLELPHAYLTMLLPLAAMMGALSAAGAARPIAWVPMRCLLVAVLALAGLLALTVRDYLGIEADQRALRLRDAGILTRAPHVPSEPLVLRWLAEAESALLPSPDAAGSLSPADLQRLRQVLARFPSAGGLARYAQASALRGQFEDSRWALHTLCGLHRHNVCTSALQEWGHFVARHPAAAAVGLPARPVRPAAAQTPG